MPRQGGSIHRGGKQGTPSGAPPLRVPASNQPKRPPKNAAMMAWEDGEHPQDEVPLPKNIRLADLRNRIQSIARDTETHIIYSTKAKPTFYIWGNQSQVDEAKGLLDAWIKDSDPTYTGTGQTGFVRLPNYTYDGKKENDRLQAVNDQRLYLRRPPSPDTTFEAIASFVWPANTYVPWEALRGRHFPVLDDIRLDHRCTIIFDYPTNTFKIMGRTADVIEAVTRVRGTFFQLKAREAPRFKTYLLHWQSLPDPPIQILLTPLKLPSCTDAVRNAKKSPMRPGCHSIDSAFSTEPDPRVGSQEERVLVMANTMKEQALKRLNKLRYYRGNLSFKIRLGTFRMSRWNGDAMKSDLETFEDMVKDYNFEASITEHIGDSQLEASALVRFKSAQGFSRSISAFTGKVNDVKPTYTAALTVDTEKHQSGIAVLTKSWEEYDGLFNETSTKWAGLDQVYKDDGVPSTLLDISMTDLKQGLGWDFEITATRVVEPENLPKWLEELGTVHYFSVIPEEARNIESDRQWCQFEVYDGKSKPVLRKRALQQRIIWQFDITNSDYTVEVSKIQNIKYVDGTTPGRETPVVYEPRWAINVVHRDWAVSLAEHTNLDIGRPASWLANLPTWFPVDDDKQSLDNNGHIELVRKLMKIQEIVCGKRDGM